MPATTCPTCDHDATHSPLVGCLAMDCDCEAAWSRPKTMADAVAERDEAMERVSTTTDPTWATHATRAINHLAVETAASGGFTADDVWDLLARVGAPECHEPRALGPLLRGMVREGVIDIDGWASSRRRHASPIRRYVPGRDLAKQLARG